MLQTLAWNLDNIIPTSIDNYDSQARATKMQTQIHFMLNIGTGSTNERMAILHHQRGAIDAEPMGEISLVANKIALQGLSLDTHLIYIKMWV